MGGWNEEIFSIHTDEGFLKIGDDLKFKYTTIQFNQSPLISKLKDIVVAYSKVIIEILVNNTSYEDINNTWRNGLYKNLGHTNPPPSC